MSKAPQRKIILTLSLLSGLSIVVVSCFGLFSPGTYSNETSNWMVQAVAQDAVDLFLISPLLIIAAIFAVRGSRVGLLIWSGVSLYIIYTYVIYCFDVHFNSLFFIYCFILGLSFYSFVYFLFSQVREPVKADGRLPVKTIGIYLMTIACAFYLLWLSQIFPSIIAHTIPKDVIAAGLPTNPIHVLDLSIVLPGFFIVAIFLMKKRPLGILLAPVILVFTVLMTITIGVLTVALNMKGPHTDYTVSIVMIILALISTIVFVMSVKNLKGDS